MAAAAAASLGASPLSTDGALMGEGLPQFTRGECVDAGMLLSAGVPVWGGVGGGRLTEVGLDGGRGVPLTSGSPPSVACTTLTWRRQELPRTC